MTAVFRTTGIASVIFSRFLLTEVLNLEGSVWSGPWSYRITYLLVMPPFYSVALLLIGTVFGKHTYFKQHVLSIWGHFVPRPFWRLRK